jgi:hypothetical protein
LNLFADFTLVASGEQDLQERIDLDDDGR